MSQQLKYHVSSESAPGKEYEVVLHLENDGRFTAGNMSCECMAWRFQKKPVNERSCKHTRHLQEELETASRELAAAYKVHTSNSHVHVEAQGDEEISEFATRVSKINPRLLVEI